MNEIDGGKIHTELSVGEAAKRSGVAVSTLHFYESKGLIHSSRSGGNQRRYQRGVLRRLKQIRTPNSRWLSRCLPRCWMRSR